MKSTNSELWTIDHGLWTMNHEPSPNPKQGSFREGCWTSDKSSLSFRENMSPYREIEIETWKRRDTFHFFRHYNDPFFNITAPVDVTDLYAHCKQAEIPFSLGLLYQATRAANAVPEFRLRLMGERVVEFERIHLGTTVLRDDDTFTFAYLDMIDDLAEFARRGRLRMEAAKTSRQLDPRSEALDLLHFSILPWISFTAFKHARRFGAEDSIPKIVLGRRYSSEGREWVPVGVDVHHALVDGLHVGRFFESMGGK